MSRSRLRAPPARVGRHRPVYSRFTNRGFFACRATGQSHGGRTAEGIYARIAQRLLAMAACIWHNLASGEPVKRSLTAYDN